MPLAIEVVAPIIVTTLADGIYPGADALLEYMPPAIEVVALIILTALEDGNIPCRFNQKYNHHYCRGSKCIFWIPVSARPVWPY